MGETAENVADKFKITAARTRTPSRSRRTRRPWRHRAAGDFADEIVPVTMPQKKGEPIVVARRAPAPRHERWRRSRSSSRCSAGRQRHRRQQLAAERRRQRVLVVERGDREGRLGSSRSRASSPAPSPASTRT
jgi:hypothetical protein